MFELLALVLVFPSAYCVGAWFLRKVDLRPLERFGLGTSLGLGVVALMIFALGVLGVLYKPVVLGVTILLPLGIGLWRTGRERLGSWLGRAKEEVHRACRESSRAEAIAVAGVLLIITLLDLSEAINWDTCPDRYHVIIARSYLNHHRVFNQPGNMLLIYPELWEGVYVVGLCFAPEAPPVLHTGVGLLTYLLLFSVGRRLVSTRAGLYAALFYGATGIVHRISPMGYNDLPLALFCLCAVYAATRFALEPKLSWAALAGAFIGFGAGCKYSAIPYVLPPALALVTIPPLIRRNAKGLIAGITGVVGFMVLTVFPWPLRSALETRNPFYPYALESFPTDERYIAEAKGFHAKFDVDPEERWARFRREFDFTQYSIATEGCGALLLFPLTGALWLWIHRRRPAVWLVLLYPVWGLFVYTLLGPRWVRYFLPAMPGVVLITGVVVGWFVDALKTYPAGQKIVAVAAAAVTLLAFTGYAFRYRGRIAVLPPLTPGARQAQLARAIPTEVDKINYLNQELGATDKVFFYPRAPRYRYIRIPFPIPYHWTSDPLVSILTSQAPAQEMRRSLRAAGITHVLSWQSSNDEFTGALRKMAVWEDAYLYEVEPVRSDHR